MLHIQVLVTIENMKFLTAIGHMIITSENDEKLVLIIYIYTLYLQFSLSYTKVCLYFVTVFLIIILCGSAR